MNRDFKKLVVFDFDATMFHTPNHEQGVIEWESKMNETWPHVGWYSHSKTIDPDIFDIPLNMWVYNKYLTEVEDDGNYVILATGRLLKKEGMLDNILKILSNNNINFREVRLNDGGDTYHFKRKLFEDKVRELGVDELVMYDDRHEHIIKFKEWAIHLNIKVTIVDVVNKKEYKYGYNN